MRDSSQQPFVMMILCTTNITNGPNGSQYDRSGAIEPKKFGEHVSNEDNRIMITLMAIFRLYYVHNLATSFRTGLVYLP